MSEENQIVAEFWGRPKDIGKPQTWLEHPVCRRLINERVTGDANKALLQDIRLRLFPETPDLALSLGCGFGAFDRMAVQSGFARRIHACDLSENATAQARAAAEAEGLADRIEYRLADLNNIDLPPHHYDIVFAMGSIHHVFQLEALFKQVRNTLKPGALFIIDEYVGPSRFQTPPLATEIINRIFAILPEKYKYNLFANDGSTINGYLPPPISWFEENDPSEAVRSSEIFDTLTGC